MLRNVLGSRRLRLFVSSKLRPLHFYRFASYKGVEYTPLLMPKLSPTATESKVAEWSVEEGTFVEAGEPYCEIETDKSLVSYEAVEEGYIVKLFKTDEAIPINSVIGIQVPEEKDIPHFKAFQKSDYSEGQAPVPEKEDTKNPVVKPETRNQSEKTNSESNTNMEEAGSATRSSGTEERRVFATPLARVTAKEIGVDLNSVELSGERKAVTKADVFAIAAKPKPAADLERKPPTKPKEESSPDYIDIPLTAMRSTIARRLLESKNTIPHFTLNSECKIDELLAFRKKLNEVEAVKISVNDLIVKACAQALKKVKEVNSSWMGSFIRENKKVDISVAVSTPTGLITPIVRDADKKGLAEISSEVKALAARAREGRLSPSEFTGGTFTISNLGMMGVLSFNAIINPPQSAILAVGAPKEELFFNKNKEVKSRKILTVSISADHRTIDGAKAAEWLKELRGFLENPITLAL